MGYTVGWKRTRAWAKVTLLHENRVVQRGKYIILIDPAITEMRWLDYAGKKVIRRVPRRKRGTGRYALTKEHVGRRILPV